MTKQEYLAFVEARNEKKLAITKAKNADYTGTSSDPFANFTSVEALGICTTEQGFLVRMMDKMMRLNSFVQKGVLEVKDESVDDTLSDLSNYADLLAGYIASKRRSGPANASDNEGSVGGDGAACPLLSVSGKAAR